MRRKESPLQASLLQAVASAWISGSFAIRSSRFAPIASAAVYPNRRSAPGFHRVMFTPSSTMMIGGRAHLDQGLEEPALANQLAHVLEHRERADEPAVDHDGNGSDHHVDE